MITVDQESKDALMGHLTEMVETTSFSKMRYYKGQIDLAHALGIISNDDVRELKLTLSERFNKNDNSD